MERVQAACPERVREYLERWPFEVFAQEQIRRHLYRQRIYPHQERYADCYDAGMLAYLYSIHRCAMMGYTHTEQYILKLIRIFTICALNAGQETRAICRENDLTELRLDRNNVPQL